MTVSQQPKVLVLSGDGINCENETAEAFRLAGFAPEIRHLNDLIVERLTLDQLLQGYRALALPGGFSFGDDLESGKVLALKIQHGLRWDLNRYAEHGGLVLGVCNGFQALIRMGVFGREVSITHNADGRFVNKWAKVTPTSGRCVWLRGLGSMDLPIRHGEGRVVFQQSYGISQTEKYERQGMLCLRYENANPNGSELDVAGMCDHTGRILGLMPHPEAFTRWTSHPEWTLQPNRAGAPGQGLAIFENAKSAL